MAQGLAALPGLSRSGLTIAALLGRRVERGEALVLSYLMSIPASLGTGVLALADGGAASTWPALAAAVVACVVGLVTIRALLAFAQRVNLGGFVVAAGVVMAAGGGVAGGGVRGAVCQWVSESVVSGKGLGSPLPAWVPARGPE